MQCWNMFYFDILCSVIILPDYFVQTWFEEYFLAGLQELLTSPLSLVQSYFLSSVSQTCWRDMSGLNAVVLPRSPSCSCCVLMLLINVYGSIIQSADSVFHVGPDFLCAEVVAFAPSELSAGLVFNAASTFTWRAWSRPTDQRDLCRYRFVWNLVSGVFSHF